MATKTAAPARHEIPLQKNGRTELQELAAVLSSHVDQRHRVRGSHPIETTPEPERFDLTATPDPLPIRGPDPFAKTVTRGARRAVPLVLAGIFTAVVTTAAWTATHAGPAAKTAAAQEPAATQPAAQSEATPTTPAQWGAAAHKRLSVGGRPVDVFACQGAYAADATVAGQILPPAATNPDPWRAYLAACLSDMSDVHVGRSG
jgi:hypothetical protein